MTDRLTDDEIKALRELRRLASFLPWATGVEFDKPDACGQEGCIHARDGVAVLEVTRGGFSNDAAYAVAACNAIDRMLDEIEERRRAERSVATVIDEASSISADTLAKLDALEPKLKPNAVRVVDKDAGETIMLACHKSELPRAVWMSLQKRQADAERKDGGA